MQYFIYFILFINVFLITNAESSKNAVDRKARFWPIGLVKFENSVCTSLEGYQGTCYTKYQCASIDGTASGSCAGRIGKCCIIQRTCKESSSHNNTYFVNARFPNPQTASSQCTFTIKKCGPDICQVRLDFLSLTLAQPDGNGYCVTDSLVITGGASPIPVICGENSGQHVYVNFDGNTDIKITVSTSAAVALSRSWNIKITQLACDCPSLAPTGCLMYYTALSGTVSSFNYGTTISAATVVNPDGELRPGTRELANLNYGVCVQMQPGYCSIQWSQGPDPTSFTVSNNTALTQIIPGLPGNGLIGTQCPYDFVIVPNPYFTNGSAVPGDRFCGNQFPTVMTSSKQFVLTVVTNGNDTTDVANRGFSLNYNQLPCASNNII